jgi:hypothetical protein
MLSFIKKVFAIVLEEVAKTKSVTRVKGVDLSSLNPEKVFEWSQQYALALDNPIYTMLINEFEVGIVNAGKGVLISSYDSLFKKYIHVIDASMQTGDMKAARDGLDKLFDIFFRIYPTQIEKGI